MSDGEQWMNLSELAQYISDEEKTILLIPVSLAAMRTFNVPETLFSFVTDGFFSDLGMEGIAAS